MEETSKLSTFCGILSFWLFFSPHNKPLHAQGQLWPKLLLFLLHCSTVSLLVNFHQEHEGQGPSKESSCSLANSDSARSGVFAKSQCLTKNSETNSTHSLDVRGCQYMVSITPCLKMSWVWSPFRENKRTSKWVHETIVSTNLQQV